MFNHVRSIDWWHVLKLSSIAKYSTLSLSLFHLTCGGMTKLTYWIESLLKSVVEPTPWLSLRISGFHLEALPMPCLPPQGAIYQDNPVLSRDGHAMSEVLALVDLRFAKRSFIHYYRCVKFIPAVLPHVPRGNSRTRALLYVYLPRGEPVFHAPWDGPFYLLCSTRSTLPDLIALLESLFVLEMLSTKVLPLLWSVDSVPRPAHSLSWPSILPPIVGSKKSL